MWLPSRPWPSSGHVLNVLAPLVAVGVAASPVAGPVGSPTGDGACTAVVVMWGVRVLESSVVTSIGPTALAGPNQSSGSSSVCRSCLDL